MKYLLLVAVMGLGSTFAFAQGPSTNTTSVNTPGVHADDDNNNRDDRGRRNVKFECFFRERAKLGVACRAWGEACADFGGRNDDERCRRDRDGRRDDRFNLSCNNGYELNERAFAFIARGGERDTRLIIEGGGEGFDRGRDGGWGGWGGWGGSGTWEGRNRASILVEDFYRFDRRDRDLASHLVSDTDPVPSSTPADDGEGHNNRIREDEFPAALKIDYLPVPFFGSCHLRTRDREHDVTTQLQ